MTWVQAQLDVARAALRPLLPYPLRPAEQIERTQWRSSPMEHPSQAVDLWQAASANGVDVAELRQRLASTGLDAEEARYVREVLYPSDAALHARMCLGAGGRAVEI